jgi:TetR/AcrR family transcriptional repressor of nem operon
MRYSREHKLQTHARILEAAGKVFRERGYNGAGVDSIMEEAGLTPGGFYAHFDSKEALLVETLKHVLNETSQHLLAGMEEQEGSQWLHTFVRRYLSREHCKAIPEGCAIPALVSEIARAGTAPRKAFEEILHKVVAEIEGKMPDQAGLSTTGRALAVLALCIGGVALARAVETPAFADKILRACREFADSKTSA